MIELQNKLQIPKHKKPFIISTAITNLIEENLEISSNLWPKRLKPILNSFLEMINEAFKIVYLTYEQIMKQVKSLISLSNHEINGLNQTKVSIIIILKKLTNFFFRKLLT